MSTGLKGDNARSKSRKQLPAADQEDMLYRSDSDSNEQIRRPTMPTTKTIKSKTRIASANSEFRITSRKQALQPSAT